MFTEPFFVPGSNGLPLGISVCVGDCSTTGEIFVGLGVGDNVDAGVTFELSTSTIRGVLVVEAPNK